MFGAVLVGVLVAVFVGVLVGVLVGVFDAVLVGVLVGVFDVVFVGVGVGVPVPVCVCVGVFDDVFVGVFSDCKLTILLSLTLFFKYPGSWLAGRNTAEFNSISISNIYYSKVKQVTSKEYNGN